MHFSFGELIVILVIVLVLFGTNRLRNLGTDLGTAIKGFREAMKEGDQEKPEVTTPANKLEQAVPGRLIEGGTIQADLDKDTLSKQQPKV
jgi:sec-independent protein translocase protein TatA